MKNDPPEQRIKELELLVSNLTSRNTVAALQKEMSLRQAIEKAIPSGIAVVDNTGKQVYVNNSFCKMFGWDENELLGKYPPYVYWAKEDLESLNMALKLTLGNNAPKEGFDLIFSHKSGKLIPVNVIVSSFIQEKNKVFWLANVIDLTERKLAEDELMKSQIFLRSSIESQRETTIFSIDRDYLYLYFNRAHLADMKFAYDAVVKIGTNILDYITSDEDRRLLKENFDRAFKGESHSIVQTFGDVNVAYYEVFFNPVIDEKGNIIGCTGLARNITERIEAEQALKDSETKFKEIINQINDGIIVFNEQGKVIIWNKGAEQLCGFKADEILNKSIVDIQYQFTPPPLNDRAAIEKKINDIVMLKTPEVFNQIIDSEIIALNSGNIRNIQSIVFPIQLNEYHLFCTVIRDVTEIKRYEKEILRISSDKDKFYSVIAQYLYTPFSLFNNFAKLMAEELDTLPIKEIQKMAVMMSKSATNLYSLLDNMLQYTKMNQGKITFEPQKLNFLKVSREAVSILKPIADSKKIKINHATTDEITVFADIFMLKTTLRNLVSNAINFTKSDGEINISAQRTQSHIVISILDNGSVIYPEHFSERFAISEIHTTLASSEEKGTTLGLLLCKEFVEKHGGKIWVENSKDKGSEVKFTLPVFT